MEVVTSESESARPDLAIPLAPIRRLARFARHYFLGLRRPGFANAHRITVAWVAVGSVLAAIAFPLSSPWQRAVISGSALIGLYVIVRALGLAASERHQHAFESEWLAARSQLLQSHAFEIVRLTVQNLAGEGGTPRRSYDLTRPAEAGKLIRLRDEQARQGRQAARVTVEFRYLARDGTPSLGEVNRDLPEVVFVPGAARQGYSSIRFPEASYIPRPGPGGYPAQATDWELSGAVVITAG